MKPSKKTPKSSKEKDTFTASEYGAFKYGDGFIDGLRKAQEIINAWNLEDEADDGA